MPFASVGDIEIYHERIGAGPRLLFISGTGGDLRIRPNVLDGPFPLVVGVSFGGMVAQELAINHPHVVEGLVLACTSPGGGGGASYPLHTLQQMDRDARARHMIPISDTRHDAAWATANEKTWEQMVAFAANDPYTDEPGHAMGQRRQLEARAAHDTWDRLGDIRCPVLISAGKYDGIALPETQRNMAARIKGAELRFYEGGHLFMLQDRAALPAMISFLKGEVAD